MRHVLKLPGLVTEAHRDLARALKANPNTDAGALEQARALANRMGAIVAAVRSFSIKRLRHRVPVVNDRDARRAHYSSDFDLLTAKPFDNLASFDLHTGNPSSY
jgi:hypothetical protein